MAFAENAIKAVAFSSAAVGLGANIVSALKVSSRGNAKSAQEYDEEEREATVYLFTSRLASALPDSTEFHHWALVIIFDGSDIRVVEGVVDEESKMYGLYTKERPKAEGNYYELAKILISPKKTLQLCESNSYNFQDYLPTWQNCQSWVKEFAVKLGSEISAKLEAYKSLKEARPFFAAVTKGSFASSNFSSRPSHMVFNSSKKLLAKEN